jgi:hypothetical protein
LALNFDGTNDRVTTSLVPVTAGTVSYSVWVYPRALNSYQGILSTYTSNSQSLELFVDATGSRFIVANIANATFTVPATVNAWQHLAVSINGTAAVSYLNGSVVSSAAITATGASASAFVIGQRSSGATPYAYNGLIDDLRLYSRTLTAPEVRLLASRRGIGLTPLPDRAAGLPRKMSVNVAAGVPKPGDLYVRTATGWRLGIPTVNTGAGGWK